ncbi:RimJ/RimL family protein N-acetyltransferase [Lipingzhangella halophila]|uniref:RimJ/RimL family protein N-acetyltransferase n=1 Tax=Lipingzhangella halophila TaxID=1783352 RepID=A0A7W7W2N5_9ACTN|nr:GNAT family protein [Lipingzhangella halophila]MBB4932127.1 RimJ/RimL family protein N-acetyltransferase [Lipingzhangella halophila]
MIDLNALRAKPTLSGGRVRLVPLTEEHTDAFYASTLDEEVRRLTGTHHMPSYLQVQEWCATRAESPDRVDLAITEQPGGRFVGELSLQDFDPDNESAGYRIALSAIEFTGQGLGREATRLILEYAFGELGLHRVWLHVHAFNMRAIAVYRACGFSVEGRMRDSLFWDGRRHDSLLMAILEHDFAKASR